MSEESDPVFSASETVVKPDVRVFLRVPLMLYSLLNLAVCLTAGWGVLAFTSWAAWPVIVFFVLTEAVIYLRLSVRHAKEECRLSDDHFVYKGGGVFSDFENELKVANITKVEVFLPYLWHQLFRTGSIRIQSAGATSTEVHLRSVYRPRDIYADILRRMQGQGFRLERNKLVQSERPHPLAVFFEVFQAFIFVFGIGAAYLADAIEEKGIDLPGLWMSHGSWIIAGAALLGLLILGVFFLHYLDLMRRVYNLYDDTIEYIEGFLNQTEAVIPLENLADSSITQSFISKMFNLFDIKLSCQGSNNEILFKNIRNGEALAANIDRLIDRSESPAERFASEDADRRPATAAGQEPTRRSLDIDRTYTAEFKIDAKRVLMTFLVASPLLILLLPIGIILAITSAVRISINTFRIKPDAIEHTRRFFSRNTVQFSFEKITGIIFTESPIDRFCRTSDILFWSIGSGQNITFRSVKLSSEDRKGLLAKKGMRPTEVLFRLQPCFSWTGWVAAHPFGHLLILLVIGVPAVLLNSPLLSVLPAAGYLAVFICRMFTYRQSVLTFYQDYIHLRQGLVIRRDAYVLYDDVKDIATLRYPMCDRGTLDFNVAGETGVSQRQLAQANPALAMSSRGKGLMRSNRLRIKYIDRISSWDEVIDTIFYRRPAASAIQEMLDRTVDTSGEGFYETRPAVVNALAGALLVLVPADALTLILMDVGANSSWILPALVGVNVLLIVSVVVPLKMTVYRLQDYRMLARSGVIFKKQISITYNKIDFLNCAQGMANKMFGNGNVSINTVGSSETELTVRNIREFRKFYAMLKERYSGRV